MSAKEGRGTAGYVVSLADRRAIVAVAAAIASVAGVVAVVVHLWREVGHVRISTAGWVAMGFGVLMTLALGIGLMALVFISSRRGYDEPAAIRVEPNKPSLDHPNLRRRRPDRPDGLVTAGPPP